MKISLPQKLYREICDHAMSDFPHEACGLLLGQKNETGEFRISKCLPSENISDDPLRAFEIDPALIIKTQKQCRNSPEQIIGHYHSHPNGRVEPSQTDLQQNYDSALIWLIVALGEGKVQELNAYALSDGRFNKIDLQVI